MWPIKIYFSKNHRQMLTKTLKQCHENLNPLALRIPTLIGIEEEIKVQLSATDYLRLVTCNLGCLFLKINKMRDFFLILQKIHI